MSRPHRIEFLDAWYHVINRARPGQEAFAAKEDYLGFIELLMDMHLKYSTCLLRLIDIKRTVCTHYKIGEVELQKSRRGVENEAHDLAIYLLRYIRSERLKKIGEEADLIQFLERCNQLGKKKVAKQ